MFIRQVPYKSTRRRRIRNWALFVLRCAAIVLLVGAFTRPFVKRELGASGALATAREVVILVDQSWSMAYGDRWSRAVDAARGAVGAIGPQERATIVFFAGGAAVASQATGDHAQLLAALDRAEVGSDATRYVPALKLAQGILESSDLPRRELLVISDFQRAGWDGGEGVRMPAGTVVTPVQITDPEPSDVAVAGVTFRREPVGDRERVVATARLTNRSSAAVRGLNVALELGGRPLQTLEADIGPNDAATITFEPFTLAEEVRGTVRAVADRLPVDDVFHFVLSPGQAVQVLVVDGGGQSTLYLERALTIGDQPPFRVELRQAGQFRGADLADRAVVVLNDAAFPAGDAGRRLRSFVEAGGGLVIVLGPRSASAGWGEGTGIVPGVPGRVTDRESGAALGTIDYSHPIFELFRAPRSGDFSAARFFRYRPVAIQDSTSRVLARFDDGSPALVEAAAGQGRILVWTSTLDNFWGDLAVQPIFLPFVHSLTRYAAGYAEPSAWFTAGQVLDTRGGRATAEADTARGTADPVAAASPAGAPDVIAIAPSGERMRIGENGLLRLAEQGFYQVRGAPRRGDLTVAVNLDLAEADLSTMDPRELTAAVEPRGDAAVAASAAALRPEERERRQSLWWYLLIAVFLLLATETAFSNRLSRRRAAATL
jgi:hypothetical protein